MSPAARESCSVCIPTFRRPHELAACLEALRLQTEPPDEIVVSDAGGDPETRDVVLAAGHGCTVRHCPTPRRALPWQRWWAFEHSQGSIVLFLDDDVRLGPDAMALLRAAYRDGADLAGVGFTITYDGSDPLETPVPLLRERWLGTVGRRPGTITAGGLPVGHPAPNADVGSIDVDWLTGGAMSFRRGVLDAIGPLHHLFALYDARIGKAEDSILSSRARRHGRLLLMVGPHAWHPAFERATRTANPQDGYCKGMLETWGRAHVLQWLASDPHAAGRAWVRAVSLELARATRAVVRHPLTRSHWLRILGDVVGMQRAVRQWRRIPDPAGRPRPSGSMPRIMAVARESGERSGHGGHP